MPQLSDYKAPYPEPDSEYQRHVIYLDPKDESVEQQHLKIELLPGKTMYVDDESKYVIQGQIDEKTVQGWGYDYYVVQFGQVINKKTQDPVQPTGPERAFIPIESAGPTLRYNSKLPIVVYVPHGAEVRYRIWYDEVARLKEQGSSLVRDGSMVKDSNAGTLNPTQVA
ncbi:ecotin, partial [Angomonas deanei]